jgi:hypothetical protein
LNAAVHFVDMESSDQVAGDGRNAKSHAGWLMFYAVVAIAMGPLWCLILSIPVSLASTVVGPNEIEMAYLTGASVLASAMAYPLLRRPLTILRIWVDLPLERRTSGNSQFRLASNASGLT